MKQVFITGTLLILFLPVFTQTITFESEDFKKALVEDLCVDNDFDGKPESTVDSNRDGEIQISEAEAVQSLILKSITYKPLPIPEITHFTNIKYLDTGRNYISEPNLDQNILLEALKIVIDDRLVVKEMMMLESINVSIRPNTTSLIISDNPRLTTANIESVNDIETLDSLILSNNKLSKASIDFSWNKNESKIFDASNNSLEELYLHKKFGPCKIFDVRNNKLTNASFTGLSRGTAEHLYLDDNNLESIVFHQASYFSSKEFSFTNNPLRKFIYYNKNTEAEVGNLDFEPFKDLDTLIISHKGKVGEINLKSLPKLDFLFVDTQESKDLHINDCKNLGQGTLIVGGDIYMSEMANGILAFTDPNTWLSRGEEYVSTEHNIYITDSSITNYNFHSKYKYDSLIISSCTQLDSLYFEPHSWNSVNILVQDMPNLGYVEIGESEKSLTFRIEKSPQLKDLNFSKPSRELKFSYENIDNLQSLTVSPTNYSIRLANLPNLHNVNIEVGPNSNLIMEDLIALDSLHIAGNTYKNLQLRNLPKLSKLLLGSRHAHHSKKCESDLTINRGSLSLQKFPALKEVRVTNICFRDVILSDLPVLNNLNLMDLDVTRDITITSLENLGSIASFSVNANSLILSKMPSLTEFIGSIWAENVYFFDNPKILSITSLTSPNITLYNMERLLKVESRRQLLNLKLSNLPRLNQFENEFSGIVTVPAKYEFSELPELRFLKLKVGIIDTLDLSCLPSISSINLGLGHSVKFLNLKNGNESITEIIGSKYLEKICVDSEVEQERLIAIGYDNLIEIDCESKTKSKNILGRVVVNDQNGERIPIDNYNFPVMLTENGAQVEIFSDPNGFFEYNAKGSNGKLNITPIYDSLKFKLVSGDKEINLEEEKTEFIEFVLQVNTEFADLQVFLRPLDIARPGEQSTYKVVIHNRSGKYVEGQGVIQFDNSVLAVEPHGALEVIGDEIRFNLPKTSPFSTFTFEVAFLLNKPTDSPPLNLDDILRYQIEVSSNTEELELFNNSFILEDIVLNSYDPNNVICLQGDHYKNREEIAPIYYVINFENNGTAPAKKVTIVNPLDHKYLNQEQVQIMEYSHNVEAMIKNDTFYFVFDNINLSYKEGANQGSVTYAIQPSTDLTYSDTIHNQAEIYFDYNFPIVTNRHELSYQSQTLGIDELVLNAHPYFNQSTQLKSNIITPSINKSFYIERRSTDEAWIRIHEFKWMNIQNNSHTYIDNEPTTGINYYRLLSVDDSGTISKSNVSAIRIKDKNRFHLSPNPVSSGGRLTLYGSSGELSVKLINNLGQQVGRYFLNNEKSFDISAYKEGIYTCIVEGENLLSIHRLIISN